MTSVAIFAGGLPLLSFFRSSLPLSYQIASSSVILGGLAALYSILSLGFLDPSPTEMGPLMAIAFCSALYAGLIFTMSSLFVPMSFRRALSRWNYAYVLVAVFSIGIPFLNIIYLYS